MKRKIFILILFPITLLVHGQLQLAKSDNQVNSDVTQDLKSSGDDEAAFNGIIYKYVDFSNSKLIGQNTEANMQQIWANDGLSSTQERNPNDRIVIVDNDTVWSCRLPGIPDGNTGTQYKGPIRVNGIDAKSDTLTYVNFTYFIRLDNNFDWSEGGKQPGLAGNNRPESLTQNPPSGGLYAPSCGYGCDSSYCVDAGFSARAARQSMTAGGENELGIYLYHHNLDWRDCDKGKTYGYNLNMGSRSDTAYKRGQWYRMTERIILNSVPTEGAGTANGIIELYKDDILVAKKTDVIYRNFSDIYVDLYYLSTLSQYDADRNRDSYIWYDDFFLWADYDRSEHELGHVLNVPKASIDNRTLTHVDNTPPSSPSNVKVSESTSNTISLAWQESVDDYGVSGYRVYLDNKIDTVISTLKYKKKGLVPESSYEFAISAFDMAGNESVKSAVVVGTTGKLDEEAPTVPMNIRANRVTGYSIEIEWDPSVDNVGVQSYEVRVDGEFEALIPNTTYTIVDLDPNTTYFVSISAMDQSENVSPFSEAVGITTAGPDEISPSSPTNLVETEVTETTIGLKWAPSSDNVSVTGYKVYVNNLEWISTTGAEAVIAHLQAGIDYDISVSAQDEAKNESPRSSSILVTTRNNDVTATPVLPTVSIVQIEENTSKPRTISKLESLGYAEISTFGLEVEEADAADQIFLLESTSLNETEVINDNRVTNGLQLMYNFSEGEGTVVKDRSGNEPAVDLVIAQNGLNTEWIVGHGLRISGNAVIANQGESSNLVEALSTTNEITVETWIKQEDLDQSGPARIISFSGSNSTRAFSIGHEGNWSSFNYSASLNTTSTDMLGNPPIVTERVFSSLSLHHLVYTRDKEGIERFFVNGIEQVSDYREGDFSSWTDYNRLVLANEVTGDRPWKGILYLVAVYNRSLDADEVQQNYNSGSGQINFSTDLNSLRYNVKYKLRPFVNTNQGLIYGDTKSIKVENIALTDSLFTFYPNPTSGKVFVNINLQEVNVEQTYLRLVDFSGKQLFLKELDFAEGIMEQTIEIQLPESLRDGLYTLIFTAGTKSVAGRLSLIR